MDNTSALQTYNKISSIVDQCCADHDLPVAHYFERFLKWALWEYKELKMDRANDVETVMLPISEALTCDMPPNMVDWVKVAYKDGQYFKTLCINSNLNKLDRTTDSEFVFYPPGQLPNGTDFASYGGYDFSNFGGSSFFSMGGALPTVGHYQVRKKAGGQCYELLLNNNFGCITEIYLEYIGIGINCCGETVVDPYLSDYVRKAVHFNYESFKRPPERSEAAIRRTGMEMEAARVKVSGRVNRLTPDDLLMISRRGYRMTNKV